MSWEACGMYVGVPGARENLAYHTGRARDMIYKHFNLTERQAKCKSAAKPSSARIYDELSSSLVLYNVLWNLGVALCQTRLTVLIHRFIPMGAQLRKLTGAYYTKQDLLY